LHAISRRLLWAGASILVVLLAVFLVPRLLLTPELLAGIINRALIPATDDLYSVGIDDLELSPTGTSIHVSKLQFRLDEQVLDSLEVLGEAPAIRIRGQLANVALDGIDLPRLVLRRELAASRFFVRHPRLEITIVRQGGQDATRVEATNPTSPGSEPPGWRVDLAAIEGVPRVAIGEVHIEDVDAKMVIQGPGTSPSDEVLASALEGLSFDLENFLLDPAAPQDPQRVAFSDDARLRFEALHLELVDGMHLDVGPLRTSSRDRTLAVGRIAVTPQYSEREFLEGGGPPGDRIEGSAGPLSFDGLAYWRILWDLDVRVRRGLVENLHVKVLSDKQRPGELQGRPWMPHDVLRELPVRLTVDTVQVVNGTVVYSERGFKGRGTGSIDISGITGTLTNISNDPQRMTADTPMQAEVTARIFDLAPVRARIRIPLLEPAPTMRLSAEVGSFDPRLINAILPALEGVRVTAGEVDTAWVLVDYGPERARGSVAAIYRDLRVRTEDRDTGKQNLGHHIVSTVANIALRGKNDPGPGKAPRAGKVDYRVPPDAPFFQVLWEAVSDGLVNLVANL